MPQRAPPLASRTDGLGGRRGRARARRPPGTYPPCIPSGRCISAGQGAGRRTMPMVRRRSTVRFRKGAPGQEQDSKDPNKLVGRTARGSGQCQLSSGATAGARVHTCLGMPVVGWVIRACRNQDRGRSSVVFDRRRFRRSRQLPTRLTWPAPGLNALWTTTGERRRTGRERPSHRPIHSRPPHTLSRTVHHCPPPSASVLGSAEA
jgi:hypothetical protein